MSLALIPPKPSDVEFLAVFNRLAVALREAQDDTGVTQGIYFDALKDLPAPAVEAGAVALMKEPGRRFFPTTAEWRTAAEVANVELLRSAVQPVEREEPWKDECGACFDTGWQFRTCAGGERGFCGRRKPHAAHDYVEPCTCRPTNRTYQRHKAFGGGAA